MTLCLKRQFLLLFLFTFFLLTLALPASSQNAGPQVIRDVHHDVSPPLRDIPTSLIQPPRYGRKVVPIGSLPSPTFAPEVADPVLQDAPGSELLVSNSLNFDGIGQGSYGFSVLYAPPDTNGKVGKTQYVQWVNVDYAVFDKVSGALIAGPIAGNALWTGFGGPCETNNSGDPIAQYDKAADRWIMTQFSIAYGGPFYQCIAVSTTGDATGSYYRYAFNFADFPDYPKLGVWPDGYYMSFNMFDPFGSTFLGAQVCAFDRGKMMTGAAATGVCFQQASTIEGILPSDLDGATPPPAGSPNYYVNFAGNALDFWKFHVDFVTPASSTFTGPTSLAVAPFSILCGTGRTCVPQTGTTQLLDSLGDRMMYRLAYRNLGDHEALVANHSIKAGSSSGVRWYEIRNPAAPVIYQQGTFAPDSKWRWMGSIAMDKAGDIAVGYSVSSAAINPAIYYTGRIPSDPLGQMEAENLVVAGTGSQTSGLFRWGDYSAMNVDPVDDCTFWYTQEYLKTYGTWNWSTRINSFSFPNCTGTPEFTLSVKRSGLGTGTITSNPAGINCGSTCFNAYNSGAVVTLTEAAGKSSTFNGWGGACSSAGTAKTCTVTMSQSQSVTANFTTTLQTFTLGVSDLGNGTGTVTSSDGQISCNPACTASYLSGTRVTLTAAAPTGNTFAGWGGACGGTAKTCAVTVSSNTSVTATFNIATFPLSVYVAGTGTGTITSGDGAINCGSVCSATYNYGSTVTLTETNPPGTFFTGWGGGGCKGTAPACTVTMTAATTVHITVNNPKLTVTNPDIESGTVSSTDGFINCGTGCVASYAPGTTVTLNAVPIAGSGAVFSNWTGACAKQTTSTCTLTINGNMSTAVVWQ